MKWNALTHKLNYSFIAIDTGIKINIACIINCWSPVNKVFKTDIPLFSISIWRSQINFLHSDLAGSKSF